MLQVRQTAFERLHVARSAEETTFMLAEEAAEWAADVVSDRAYDYYVAALITHMWSKPECRDGMLEFVGEKKRAVPGVHLTAASMQKAAAAAAAAAPTERGKNESKAQKDAWLQQVLPPHPRLPLSQTPV